MLVIDQVSFAYGRTTALEDVAFDVAPGEIVGVVGPNGAGKSTLLRLLAAVHPPLRGAIRLDSLDAYADSFRYRREIGYLAESCPLYDEMSADEYLYYRARLKRERYLRLRRRVREAMERLGLDSVRGKPIARLSLGYRKRIGLADALLLAPRVLVLDDPLAGLDPAARREVGRVLTAVSTRAAVVVSGHALEDMARFCTRFAVLRQGRLTAMLKASDHAPEAWIGVLAAAVGVTEEAS